MDPFSMMVQSLAENEVQAAEFLREMDSKKEDSLRFERRKQQQIPSPAIIALKYV